MKFFLKNTVVIFLIIFFILSVFYFIDQEVETRIAAFVVMNEAEKLSKDGIPAEKTNSLMASTFYAGVGNRRERRNQLFLASIASSLVISFAYTFYKNRKNKTNQLNDNV